MFTEDITTIATAVISLVGTALGGVLIWFITEKVGTEKAAKINAFIEKTNLEFIFKQQWAKEAVQYAEQALKDSNGPQKLNAVLEFMTKKANDAGVDVSRSELEVLIEAQVKKIKDSSKEGWTQINTTKPVIVEEKKTTTDSSIDFYNDGL